MDASGRITVEGREHQVSGRVWFDREWSTSALEAQQVGWDWFALRLGEAGELMLYSMRRNDGARDRHASGTWTDARGVGATLDADDFEIEVLAHWTSPRTGVRYPSRWRVRVPSRELELELTPLLADQELDHAVRYWEGAVRIEGALRGARIDSRGYVELAGYGS
jgi:predicted secreted hydrolase